MHPTHNNLLAIVERIPKGVCTLLGLGTTLHLLCAV